MAQVEVYNDNTYPFEQKFKGDLIQIPARDYIEMEEDEALQFVSAWSPVKVDSQGVAKPESYKMLRIVGARGVAPDPLQCMACGYKAVNKQDLKAHTEARLDDGKHKPLEEDGNGEAAVELQEAHKKIAELDGKLEKLMGLLEQGASKKKTGSKKKDVREAVQE